MSISLFLFSCFLAVTFAANSTYTKRHNASLNIWNALKQENGDCYTYSTSFTSWTGHGSTTTIKVENGIVIQRSYEAHTWDNTNNVKTITDSWIENTTQTIGTNSDGAAVKTMDELYQMCPDYIGLDEANNYIDFKTNQLGIMIQCGYYPKNCADDCSRGITIGSFYFCPTTPATSTCDILINDIILKSSSQNIGDTLVIKAYNTANNNVFSYPSFAVYVVNGDDYILFGKEEVDYYGIGVDVQGHTITSNTSTVTSGSMIRLYIELWAGTNGPIKECTFNWYGIPTSNISTTTTTSSASSTTSSILPTTSAMASKSLSVSIISISAMIIIIV